MPIDKMDNLPASKSSFSLPLILLESITSPVPLAPNLPFRKTRAREVVGLRPFSSRLPPCFETLTCRGPTGTRSLDVERIGGTFAGFFLDAMDDRC